MSRILKNIVKKEHDTSISSDNIVHFLMDEIEDIVSKKIDIHNYHENTNYSKENSYNPPISEYSNTSVKNQPESLVKMIRNSYRDGSSSYRPRSKFHDYIKINDSDETSNAKLPFDELDIKPIISDEKQIRSEVKKTLKPALSKWLEDNLDYIIEDSINKYIKKSRHKRRED